LLEKIRFAQTAANNLLKQERNSQLRLHYFKTELKLRSPQLKNGLTSVEANPFLLFIRGAT